MKRYVGLYIFLLCSHHLTAQHEFAAELQKRFSVYQSANLQEKLFVHTDKTFYLAGETLWFKIYSVDESLLKPLSISSIAYVEIISNEQKPILQTKISMHGGTGNGSFTLPGSLVSGNYVFRAYTSWMKNFPADFYYEQTISIVNTLKGKAPRDSGTSAATIQFFPEGGSLVNGITSLVAFKATAKNGKSLSCNGVILNQKKDTLVHFASGYRGMGNLLLTPKKNDSYYAVVKLGDSLYIQKLPDPADRGFTLHLTPPKTGKLKITVHATDQFFNSTVYLFAQTRHIIKSVQSVQLDGGTADFVIDEKELGAGITTFTLFNASRQPVCERLFFKRPAEKLQIEVKTDQITYSPRKKVTLSLTATGFFNHPTGANMSLSVFLLDSLQPLPEENIYSYLLLTSELKGHVESPEYYVSHTDNESDQAIDNLLLTQGWRRFKWNDVLQFKKPFFEFLPETEGPVVNAKIVDRHTGLPGQNIPYFLTIPGSDFAFCSSKSNAEGNILFTFKDIYKNNALILQNADRKDSNYRIDISNPYSDRFAMIPVNDLSISKVQASQLLSRSIGSQIENTYRIGTKHQYLPHTDGDSTSFFGKPDRSYYLDDYTRFASMEEVMREYVEDVRVRKEGEKYRFRVRNLLFNTFFDEDPLILIDGLPVSDASKVIALDPLKIKKIEVESRRYFTGSLITEGIVSVKSYDGDLGASELDPDAIVLEYDGLQEQREFYSPAYSDENGQHSSIPDYRNVLLWSPQINTGKEGKTQLSFFTSDIAGKFAVVVQGISAEGLAGTAVTGFHVADSK